MVRKLLPLKDKNHARGGKCRELCDSLRERPAARVNPDLALHVLHHVPVLLTQHLCHRQRPSHRNTVGAISDMLEPSVLIVCRVEALFLFISASYTGRRTTRVKTTTRDGARWDPRYMNALACSTWYRPCRRAVFSVASCSSDSSRVASSARVRRVCNSSPMVPIAETFPRAT